jgi:hypothetical protein
MKELQKKMNWAYDINRTGCFKKKALQWHSKWFCGASVTKTFTFEGVKGVEGVVLVLSLGLSGRGLKLNIHLI